MLVNFSGAATPATPPNLMHFQLMSGPDVMTAYGLPFEWHYRDGDGTEHTGVPEDFTHFKPAQSPVAVHESAVGRASRKGSHATDGPQSPC